MISGMRYCNFLCREYGDYGLFIDLCLSNQHTPYPKHIFIKALTNIIFFGLMYGNNYHWCPFHGFSFTSLSSSRVNPNKLEWAIWILCFHSVWFWANLSVKLSALKLLLTIYSLVFLSLPFPLEVHVTSKYIISNQFF